MLEEASINRTVADVVVVGGGGAGLAAENAAAELGRHVILLEKNPDLGGSTALSVGSVSATCTPHQIAKGIKDSPELHLQDAMRFSGALLHRDNVALVRVLTENSPDMFRWLLSTGLEFVGPFPEPPHRHPRMHNVLPNSKAFPYVLGRHCRRSGVDIRLDTRADRLIFDGVRIEGVAANLADGRTHEFIAKGGVVLAGGDFSASKELKARYASAPRLWRLAGFSVCLGAHDRDPDRRDCRDRIRGRRLCDADTVTRRKKLGPVRGARHVPTRRPTRVGPR